MNPIRHSARWTRRLSATALLASALGCSNGLDPSELQVVDAERKWLASGVTNYSMVVTRGTTQAPPVAVRVTVTQGTVSDRQYTDDGGPVPAAEAAKFPSVDGLFDLVRDAFRRAANVSVTFDATYGFPTSIVADYVRNSLEDDVTVAVTQFTPSP